MPDASAGAAIDVASTYQQVALGLIHPSPTNPRKTFDRGRIEELAASMKDHGLAQPILVRPSKTQAGFELIAGERRWRAATELQWESIACIVRDLDDRQTLEIQVIENLQRDDLHELEEAEGYEQLMKAAQYSADQVAIKIGKSRSYVFGRLKLLALCPKAREAFRSGEIDGSKALLIARIPHDKLQLDALKEIGDDTVSYRRAAELVHRDFTLRLDQAPFKTDDALLVKEAGPCSTCPKRTGNQPELFGDVKSADICTDPLCFASKRTAHSKKAVAEAKAAGAKVIEGREAKKILPYDSPRYVQNGFTAADSTVYDDPKQRKASAIAKEAGIEPVLVVHPASGVLVETFDEKKVHAAAKKAAAATRGTDTKAQSTNAKLKLAKAYREKLFLSVTEAARGRLTTEDWVMVAQYVVRSMWHDSLRRLAKLRDWDKAWIAYGGRDELDAAIAAMSPDDIALLLFQAPLLSDLHVNEHSVDNAKPETLEAVAKRFDVDAAAIKRDVAAELTPKKVAKQTSAKKGTAKDATARPTAWPQLEAKAGPVKYRNDATGETWSGRGKAPKWIEGKDRAPYLVATPAPMSAEPSEQPVQEAV